ncbi:N-acetyltransferase [Stutzerimonas kirkiae]|nr:N-acetyltransferase [Stutzerimonas kirkiae]TBV10989.1 N-acetyltransferase [Stutzerimonas kirkiae]TBV14348.1 N-acetyltransferase [Stutzerimonas kirkiae]
MIRAFHNTDMDTVLDIWLRASIKAHDFVAPGFWQAQRDDMRDIYIPSAEVHVYEEGSKILGFHALLEDRLAALFVMPERQGRGIGKALMADAKARRERLVLSVYKSNTASVGFYLSQGFSIECEGRDEATGHDEYIMRMSA